VSEEAVLDVIDLEGIAQERVVPEVDHADRQVIAGAPPGVDTPEVVTGKRSVVLAVMRIAGTRVFAHTDSPVHAGRVAPERDL
jgi:hypothetical protein